MGARLQNSHPLAASYSSPLVLPLMQKQDNTALILSEMDDSGFISIRTAPLLFEERSSMLFIGMLPYYRDEPPDLSGHGDPHGLIAPFARRNYYRMAVDRLKAIRDRILKNSGLRKKQVRIFCNSRIPEKLLAAAAGCGVYGKNGLILNREGGSLCILAGMIMDHPTETIIHPEKAGEKLKDSGFPLCGSCTRCIEACPTGAITAPAVIDRRLCLQSLATVREELGEPIMQKWGYMIYGCQICQEVCPLNSAPVIGISDDTGVLGPSISLRELLSLSPDSLAKRIQRTVLDRAWIDPLVIYRNALIAAGNRGRKCLAPVVNPYLGHEQSWIRSAAQYAAEKIR